MHPSLFFMQQTVFIHLKFVQGWFCSRSSGGRLGEEARARGAVASTHRRLAASFRSSTHRRPPRGRRGAVARRRRPPTVPPDFPAQDAACRVERCEHLVRRLGRRWRAHPPPPRLHRQPRELGLRRYMCTSSGALLIVSSRAAQPAGSQHRPLCSRRILRLTPTTAPGGGRERELWARGIPAPHPLRPAPARHQLPCCLAG